MKQLRHHLRYATLALALSLCGFLAPFGSTPQASPRNPRLVASTIGSTFLRTIWLDDSYHMITSDNEREIVARETALFLRESEITSRTGDAGGKPVVSKALARRLRQLAAMGKGRA